MSSRGKQTSARHPQQAPAGAPRKGAPAGGSSAPRSQEQRPSVRPVVVQPAPPAPSTLRDLILETQRLHAEGADQEEVIAWVYTVAERFGILVRHDEHEPHRVPVGPAAAPAAAAAAPAAAAPAAAAPAAAAPAAAAPAAAAAAAAAAPAEAAAADAATDAATGAARVSKSARKKAAKQVSVPVTRQADGSHRLALGSIFDPDFAEKQAPPPREATVARLVLSGDKRGGGAARGRGTPLYYECNGLVIDARTWRALAVPPSAFNPRPATKAVDALLAEGLYDIIRVDDGTVVTLYSWQHPVDGAVWALASSNGYDVSSLCWIGQLTYAEVFYDITSRLYPAFGAATGMSLERKEDGTTRLRFTSLDASRCYTVGFRHHNFHPLAADPERMWQIQCTDLSGATPTVVYSGGLPAIPEQSLCADLAALASEAALAAGKPSDTPLTVEGLRALGRDAFSRATAFIAGRAGSAPAAAALPAELNYGYILRSRDPSRTGEHSDILVETPLLERVRKFVYERAPRTVRDELTSADRLEYNAMRAYLTASERLDFLALYPNWVPRFQAFEEFVNNVVHLVIHAIRQRAMAPASREPAMKSATGQVARALLDHICRYESLTAFHKDTESIVRDYVVNPEYAFLFLRAMRSAVPAAAPGALGGPSDGAGR